MKLKNADFPILLEIFIQFWFIAFLYPWGVIKVELIGSEEPRKLVFNCSGACMF